MSETSVANDTSGLVPQRQKASDYDNHDPAPELQHVSPSADTTVLSKQELDLLSGPLYDEFFNDSTFRVNKSSSLTDNFVLQDTHPSTNIHPTSEPSTPTNVHAEENNDNQEEFTNPFCIPVQENVESSSRNIDPKMCMLALTVSIVEPKNIKEAMADSAWIEAIHEELHQFERLQVWELVDKPFGKNEEGIDFEESFAPVARLEAVKSTKIMHSIFEMSLMGEMKFFLGLQIHQSPRGIFINQAKYTLEILKKHGMEKGQSIGTPMATKPKLDADLSGEPVDQSRPDIVQVICYCARYQARPTEKHLKEMPTMPDALILAKALLEEYSSYVIS
ncbi:retrovirus-related pol polyprotein from transposon TNT 1-94 [Tanacetum coccineum]